MINNTSVFNQRHQAAGLEYLGLAAEITPNAGGQVMKNHVYINNIGVSVASAPRDPFTVGGTFTGDSEQSNNLWFQVGSGDVAPQFVDIENFDFRLQPGSAGIDTGRSNTVSVLDIGFDPRCIKKMANPGVCPYPGEDHVYPWVQYEPDLDYIKSLGGIRYCFHPVRRPQGEGYDIGAYER
jgi:hypothetical protein